MGIIIGWGFMSANLANAILAIPPPPRRVNGLSLYLAQICKFVLPTFFPFTKAQIQAGLQKQAHPKKAEKKHPTGTEGGREGGREGASSFGTVRVPCPKVIQSASGCRPALVLGSERKSSCSCSSCRITPYLWRLLDPQLFVFFDRENIVFSPMGPLHFGGLAERSDLFVTSISSFS